MTSKRIFVVIPAAGHSRRMGRPKLILPLAGESIIARVVRVFEHPSISLVAVVVRSHDRELQRALVDTSAHVIVPDVDPPQMRESVEIALKWIENHEQPTADDGWMLCPADHPLLKREILDQLLDAWRSCTQSILIPTYEGKRGHPVIFRWGLTRELFELPDDVGVNRLVALHADDLLELEIPDEEILFDLDTPEDFEKLSRRIEFC